MKKGLFHFKDGLTAVLCAEDFENAIGQIQEDRGARDGYFLLKNDRLYRFIEVLKALGINKQGIEFKPKGYVADYAQQLKEIGISLLKRSSVLNTKFLVARDTHSENGKFTFPGPERAVSGLLLADFGTALYKGFLAFSGQGFGLHGISQKNPEPSLVIIIASSMWKENDLVYACPINNFDALFRNMKKMSTRFFAVQDIIPFIEDFPFKEYENRADNFEEKMMLKLARLIFHIDGLISSSITRYDVFFLSCDFANASRISRELNDRFRLVWCDFDNDSVGKKDSMQLKLSIGNIGYMRIEISSNNYLETLHDLITRSLGMDHDYEHSFIRDGQKIKKENLLKLHEVFWESCRVVEYRSRYKDKFKVSIEYIDCEISKDLRIPSCLDIKGLELDREDIDFILGDLEL